MNVRMSIDNLEGIRFHDTRFEVLMENRALPLIHWVNIPVPEPYQAGSDEWFDWFYAFWQDRHRG